MIQQGQGLPFQAKSNDDIPGIHSRFDNLDRDPTPNGFLLLCEEDDRGASLADQADQTIRPDAAAGNQLSQFRTGLLIPMFDFARRTPTEKTSGCLVRTKKRFDFSSQLGAIPTGGGEEICPLFGIGDLDTFLK